MAKVVFFFAGTGRTAEEYQREHEGFLDFPKDVIRIYVNGCQDSRVGGLGGAVSPDLNVATDKITAAFRKNNQQVELDLYVLRKNFGDAIILSGKSDTISDTIKVDSLALEGYSRGAVQTLAVASVLNTFPLNIDLIANQPVTGEKYGNKPLFEKYKTVATSGHIRSATTLFAMHETQVNPLHDRFYTTMRPIFDKETKLREILLPQQIHKRSAVLGSGENLAKDLISTPAPYHIAEALAEHGYASVKQGLIPTAEETQAVENVPTEQEGHVLVQNESTENEDVLNAKICQKHWYSTQKNSYYFTPYGFSQEIYGIDGDYRDQVTESPQFLNMKIEEANQLLNHKIDLIENNETISSHPEKFKAATCAMAITIVSETFETTQGATLQSPAPKLYEFLASKSEKALQLSKIIKLVDNVCLHLQLRQAMKASVKKRRLIEENAKQFKQKIFLACHAYLSKTKTSDADAKDLIDEINAAKSNFLSTALSKDRSYLSWALRPIGKMIGALILLPGKMYAWASRQSNGTQQEPINSFSVRSKKLVRELKNQIVSESILNPTKSPK